MIRSKFKAFAAGAVKQAGHYLCVAWHQPTIQSLFWTYVARWATLVGIPAAAVAIVAEVVKAAQA